MVGHGRANAKQAKVKFPDCVVPYDGRMVRLSLFPLPPFVLMRYLFSTALPVLSFCPLDRRLGLPWWTEKRQGRHLHMGLQAHRLDGDLHLQRRPWFRMLAFEAGQSDHLF